ncbi:stage 0 sporulation protein [Candidatus Acetothermia bacterium]|nr:MAG: stage 0 sporulation protein [Candidatus Acetothermia bacterium]
MMDGDRIVLVRVYDLTRSSEYFHASGIELSPGDKCVVDHNGLRLGEVLNVLDAGSGLSGQLERVVRIATPRDIETHSRNLIESEQVLSSAREVVNRHGLPMHLVAAEYTLDRAQLRIYFTAPHRVDFRALLRELAGLFGVRIDLRQMGARDEAKIKGGIGRCGRPVCCHAFLREPRSIPMEIAYDQELFVSPERITGICGRLMCCLAYEHETYKEAIPRLPRLGARVSHGKKKGKVISHNIFRNTVIVLTDNGERVELPADKVKVISGEKRQGK